MRGTNVLPLGTRDGHNPVIGDVKRARNANMPAASMIFAVRIPIPHELVVPLLVVMGGLILLSLLVWVADKLATDGSRLRLLAIVFLLVGGPALMGFTMVGGFRSLLHGKCRDDEAYAELKARHSKPPDAPKPTGTRPGDEVIVHAVPAKFAKSLAGSFRTEDVRANLTIDGAAEKGPAFAGLPVTVKNGWNLPVLLIRGPDGGRGVVQDEGVVVPVRVVTPADDGLLGKRVTLEVSGRVFVALWAKEAERGYVIEADSLAGKESVQFIARDAVLAHERALSGYQDALLAWEAQQQTLHADEQVLDQETESRFHMLEWATRGLGFLCLAGVGLLYWRGRRSARKQAATKVVP